MTYETLDDGVLLTDDAVEKLVADAYAALERGAYKVIPNPHKKQEPLEPVQNLEFWHCKCQNSTLQAPSNQRFAEPENRDFCGLLTAKINNLNRLLELSGRRRAELVKALSFEGTENGGEGMGSVGCGRGWKERL
ncbi:MAG: hypothetical protein LBD08_04970 [Treponema sp.]|nr:hypothetical protein [Treponema sp.]